MGLINTLLIIWLANKLLRHNWVCFCLLVMIAWIFDWHWLFWATIAFLAAAFIVGVIRGVKESSNRDESEWKEHQWEYHHPYSIKDRLINPDTGKPWTKKELSIAPTTPH